MRGTAPLVVALVFLIGVPVASAETELISRQSDSAGGGGGDGGSAGPSISGDGRLIAFSTRADNLGGPRDPTVENVYLFDTTAHTTTLLSRQSKPAGGDGADGHSRNPSISADGRFVAFETEATNLGGPAVTGRACQQREERPCRNVYVYDTRRQRVELVSRRDKDQGGRGGDGSSFNPSISADGLSVGFETYATNLGGPIQALSNVYVYDRDRDEVDFVSRQSKEDGGQGSEPGAAGSAAVSADGRFVAFWTNAQNLGGPKTAFNAIYVYDRGEREVSLVSRQSAADGGDGAARSAYYPSISDDGRFVAFFTYAGNLGGPVQTAGSIYVYDREQEAVELVSRQGDAEGGAGADAVSEYGEISGDGRFVAFETQATNLGGPIQALRNVYTFDRGERRLELGSRQSASAGGAGADSDSRAPALSGDGGLVAFTTRAGNLADGAVPDVLNVYGHR